MLNYLNRIRVDLHLLRVLTFGIALTLLTACTPPSSSTPPLPTVIDITPSPATMPIQPTHLTPTNIVASPTPLSTLVTSRITSSPTLPPSSTPPAPAVATGQPLRILQPKEGEQVDRIIEVAGELALDVPTGHSLTIAVRPLPQQAGQSWWIQQAPVITAHQWDASSVYIGQDSDAGKNFSFRICAIVAERTYQRGDQLPGPPQGSSDCVTVTRR